MLSDRERRSLQRVEAHLAGTDPGFARRFAANPPASACVQPRHILLLWGIATCVVLLRLLTLGVAVAHLRCTAPLDKGDRR